MRGGGETGDVMQILLGVGGLFPPVVETRAGSGRLLHGLVRPPSLLYFGLSTVSDEEETPAPPSLVPVGGTSLGLCPGPG